MDVGTRTSERHIPLAGGSPHALHLRLWSCCHVLCVAEFEGDEVIETRLYPIELGWKAPRSQRGTPWIVPDVLGQKIIEHLAELSTPFGTQINYEDGIGVWRR